jgi:beta-N-acetylhexosaminidase
MSAAAGLVIVGVAGPRLTRDERDVLSRLRPGGVILFGRNVESAGQVAALTAELHAALPEALVCIDAEGGRVDRLRSVVGPSPAAAALADASPARAGRAGLWLGRSLRALGFDVDFAPVVDLDRGHTGNALDGRCFGATPRAVAARAGAFLEGLHRAGVGGCVKHFPGLGGAQADTHLLGAPIELDRAELERDLAPFARLAAAAGAVMIGHASYPAYDSEARPGSLSPPIADTLLRRKLRFRGVSFSDDLEMKALGAFGDLPEVAAAALAAGCDVLAVCGAASLEALPAIARRLGVHGLRARRQEALRRLSRYRLEVSRLRRLAEAVSVEQARRGVARLAGITKAGIPA